MAGNRPTENFSGGVRIMTLSSRIEYYVYWEIFALNVQVNTQYFLALQKGKSIEEGGKKSYLFPSKHILLSVSLFDSLAVQLQFCFLTA